MPRRLKDTYRDRIATDPKVMVGKPVVKGTRIPVERVIRHLAYKPDLDDLFAAYPELTMDDVKACLAYAGAAIERQRSQIDCDETASARIASA